MPTYFHKPENALKRAHEFIKVGESDSALEVLNDVLRSRKHRGKWTPTHESIMLLFTKLCIDLHRSSYAKDGLYQYRNICKEANPSSFEKVVKTFLANAEEKASAARQESEQAVLQDVEDLDNDITPESILLSTVSGEGAKERSDRVLLTPWVKFLWESYRNMLELLKNNNTVQAVYASVARDAFKFCLNFQRRTEFRKLCDTLHNHLSQAQKYQNQQYSLKFDQPETIQCLVDVRFEQLESSIKIDLWQEAFRAIEEIHNLLGISGKAPKPALLENFYVKQAKVYWMAHNELFHAAALHKLFVLRKEQKKTFSTCEASETASQVLLSTLCIPVEPVPSEADRFLEVDDNTLDKSRRLSSLLRMSTPPTRASLLKELVACGVVEHASPDLQQLYNCLEVEFNPLLLCKKVLPILERLKEVADFGQYVESLKDITLVRLIKQVAQVYDSIEIERLAQLAPFTTVTHLEKVVVETAHTNNIQVRVDHGSKCLSFGRDLSFSHKNEAAEGPYVQAMPSANLCSQLTLMSKALQQAVRIISSKEMETEQMLNAKKASQEYNGHFRGDHRQATGRKNLIESRKEFIENKFRAKEEEEVSERKRREKLEREAERVRLEREAREREEQRKNAELKELKRKRAEDRLENLKKTAVGARALADVKPEDLDEMDADDIFSKQLKQMEKEKRDKESKLRAQEKKVDYFERAKRLLEIPLLKEQYEEQREYDRKYHKEQEEANITTAISDRKEAEACNARLAHMRNDEKKFKEEVKKRRQAALQDKLIEFELVLQKAREEKLEQRKKERKERRKAEATETAKAESERDARLKAEKEREALDEKRREREAEFEAQRQKQMQRDREIEEKAKERERKYEEERMAEKRMLENRGPPKERDEGDSWRRKSPEPEEKESSYPQRHDQETKKGGYRPPAMRSTEQGDWRTNRDEDRDRRGRDSYDSPRGDRRGGGRDFDRDDRRGGGRDFDRDDRRGGGRDFDRDDRRGGGRDFDRDDRRGGGGRDFDRDDRRGGGRDFDRDDRRGGGRDFDRDDRRGGGRDFDRDDRRGGGRDFDRDRGESSWRSGDRSQRRGYGDDRPRRPAGDDWRRDERGGDDDRSGPRRPRDDDRGERRGWRDDGGRERGGWGRGDRSRGEDREGGRGWRDQGDRPPRDQERRRDHSPREPESRSDQSPPRKRDEDGFEVVSRRR